MNDVKLYHGSRGGIVGKIKPMSRQRCDFGQGFYMGTNPQQVRSLVCEEVQPVYYVLKLKLSEIPEDRILHLEGEEWVNAVLANRQANKEFSRLQIAKDIMQKLTKYDIIYGTIADDRMDEAMRRFMQNGLTTAGLLACLQSVDYGIQYVARTEFACSKIEILTEHDVTKGELQSAREYGAVKRREGIGVVDKMAKLYPREGKYLSEIISEQSVLEQQAQSNQNHGKRGG
jgi:hypothetical protein